MSKNNKRKYSNRVIIFSRYPEPGKAKTRLIPSLGAEGAAGLQRRMTEHIIEQVRQFQRSSEAEIEVRYEGGDKELIRYWLGRDLIIKEQGLGDMGEKMLRSFREASQSGARHTILIGSDCPGITPLTLQRALLALEANDLVLGPASDGGYYLIGLNRPVSALFKGISWGSGMVLDQTRRIAAIEKITFAELDILDDVDRHEDIPQVERTLGIKLSNNNLSSISIIIPALNEERNLSRTLSGISKELSLEVILVDGGSTDRTKEIALSHGARAIDAPPGRASQMNRGAAHAKGEILLFLHADTLLPDGFSSLIRSTLSRPGIALGAFRLFVDSPWKGLRFIEKTTFFRSNSLKMPYGDQALFLRAALFHKLGGYPEIPILEDIELVRAARNYGEIVTLDQQVITSARRWHSLGFWRVTIINQLILLGRLIGIAPKRLARLYNFRASGRD